MNLCRLLVAVSLIFPRNNGETDLQYAYRRLLIAASAIKAIEHFAQCSEQFTSGSDPKIGEVLEKYYTLTKTCHTNATQQN